MSIIDWLVVLGYILIVIGIGFYLSRRQRNQEDYYTAGRAMKPLSVALSMVATQVSAVSLIGVPAFISLREGGGLIWWQYEFAVPLAMIGIMVFLVPLYYKFRVITIYEFLERNFGKPLRVLVSLMFLISRGLSTGVILYATSIATSSILDLPLSITILLVAIVTITYTTLGGIAADIYSDVIQLIVLWGSALVMAIIMISYVGLDFLNFVEPSRLKVYDFSSTGLGDGKNFGFWPMLLGGLFLYLSYYGTDQSEAQRLLTTPSKENTQKALTLNGLLRFPLVFTYSIVGILLLAYMRENPEFLNLMKGKPADFVVPTFVKTHFPMGFVGLFMGGILAATMSSIDSALNALSAATYRDFLSSMFPSLKTLDDRRQLLFAKVLTVFWGIFSLIFAFTLMGGHETVVEVINKIGSAFYGPVFGVFFLGAVLKSRSILGAILGLILGFALNISLWVFFKNSVSWMWWNMFGFITTVVVGYMLSLGRGEVEGKSFDIISEIKSNKWRIVALLGMFAIILTVSWIFQTMG